MRYRPISHTIAELTAYAAALAVLAILANLTH